jgi:cyclic pyranopterin phosphate synthase
VLRFEEIEAIVRAGAELGIKKVRLTGGEPLARAGIASLAQKLCAIPGLNDMAMTTNGRQFSKLGSALRDAGLRRVNFGISSLDSSIYSRITRLGRLGDALEGLETAIKLGFGPIKVNVVAMRGINDDLSDFLALAKERPVQVRFIEYMPSGDADHSSFFVPASEIAQRVEAGAELEALEPSEGYGPIQSAWSVRGGLGSVAILAPITGHICGQCNRLRLTADGQLRLCLFSKAEIDLKPALRPEINHEMLKSLLTEGVCRKPKSLHESTGSGRKMSQIGG